MDLTRSHWWYRRALGFLAGGERRSREGEMFAAVPGLPDAAFDVWCLVGRGSFLQIEMFEFGRPRMRPRPAAWRPCDIGYARIGVHVPDFDGTLDRIARIGGEPLTAPLGNTGRRRVCVPDPDGIYVELMEDHPLADAAPSASGDGDLPAIASVTLSVPSLSAARAFWVDVLGCEEMGEAALHDPAHEQLWGLAGAERSSMVVRSGDVALEFVQYASPAGRQRPAGFLISDQGILNVALGTTDYAAFAEAYERAVAHGFRGHTDPWTVQDVATVVYLCDPLGFSIELLHVERKALERMGFRPVTVTTTAATDGVRTCEVYS
jgi:catechol 2,3-dioxygenase-like lactoylglutathione lyase family enzyme